MLSIMVGVQIVVFGIGHLCHIGHGFFSRFLLHYTTRTESFATKVCSTRYFSFAYFTIRVPCTICAVTYMTGISLIVTINNLFTSHDTLGIRRTYSHPKSLGYLRVLKTAEWRSTKLDDKQDINVFYPVRILGPDWGK